MIYTIIEMTTSLNAMKNFSIENFCTNNAILNLKCFVLCFVFCFFVFSKSIDYKILPNFNVDKFVCLFVRTFVFIIKCPQKLVF